MATIVNNEGEVVSHLTRSIFGTLLQICQNRHAPFSYQQYTTLNEKFKIFEDEHKLLDPYDYPRLDYFSIGRGGHRNTTGADGADLNEALYHRAKHASLYWPLAFAARPLSNPLSVAERAKYGLRCIEELEGELHEVYYLKRLPKAEDTPVTQEVSVVDGVEKVKVYEPSSSMLQPEPPTTSIDGVTEVSGVYLTTSENLRVYLTRSELDEIINACKLKYGSSQYAVISELAFVHGHDKVVTANDHNGVPFNYTEVIGAQCNYFYCSLPKPLVGTEDFDITFDAGASDALPVD